MGTQKFSVVGFNHETDGYRCGYCGSSDGNSSYGMEAFILTPSTYQTLLDRGWRRSGSYCYKPSMSQMCCPSYTIRCEALNFRISKSQKKVLKRMRKFLITGEIPEKKADKEEPMEDVKETAGREVLPERSKPADFSDRLAAQISDVTDGPSDVAVMTSVATDAPSNCAAVEVRPQPPVNEVPPKSNCGHIAGADPSRPPCRKAKDVRRERRLAKLAAKGADTSSDSGNASFGSAGKDGSTSSSGAGGATSGSARSGGSGGAGKSLEDLINEPLPDDAKHFLELRMVRPAAADGSADHRLFQAYQMAVHRETAADCLFNTYSSFLCESPFPPPQGEEDTLGSFHQQYWLDGRTLIAVAVLDVLPGCVSSVYLFYDPAFSFLSLGTYSALREIALVRALQRRLPALRHYYMGFYIHSCPKMRYKGAFAPSWLLCPLAYAWRPLEQCRPLLDAAPYSRLSEGADPDLWCLRRLPEVLMLHQRTVYSLERLEQRLGEEVLQREALRAYVERVGRSALDSLVLYSRA